MTGILILAHGSRQKEPENTLFDVVYILEDIPAEIKAFLKEYSNGAA